jgi:hypothetical protein
VSTVFTESTLIVVHGKSVRANSATFTMSLSFALLYSSDAVLHDAKQITHTIASIK